MYSNEHKKEYLEIVAAWREANGQPTTYQRPLQEEEPYGKLEHIKTSAGLMTDRFFALLKSQGKADDQAENVTWDCPTCGIILPKKFPQGYMRAQCDCKRVEVLRQERAKYEAMQQEKVVKQQAKLFSAESCYYWLGSNYSEQGLELCQFSNFKAERAKKNQEGLRIAKNLLMQFAQNPRGPLGISGPCGTGKTELVCALANYLRGKGISCLYSTASNLFDKIEHERLNHGDIHAIQQKMILAQVLIVDEMEKKEYTPWRGELWRAVFGQRFNREKMYPGSAVTIIIANIDLEDPGALIPFIGDSATSRLRPGYRHVSMQGDDFRKQL